MGYSKLFDAAPVVSPKVAAPVVSRSGMFEGTAMKTNLFREERKLVTTIADIETWQTTKPHMTTTANRINFVLSGLDVKKLQATNISDIGGHQVEEATEANNCVDQVVNDFAQLKEALEEPKNLILRAVDIIENASKPLSFLEKFKGVKRDDWIQVRTSVKNLIDQANDLMKSGTKYHINPFIEGLGDASYYLVKIIEELNNTINALDYVYECCPDPMVKDLALRRKEMFTKSFALMQMNKGQVDQMTLFCEKNKHFATELEMTIKPLIENILRTALISDTDGETALKEIQLKLKGIL
jgi:hypothetical protein